MDNGQQTVIVNPRFSVGASFAFSTYSLLFFISGMGWLGENCFFTIGVLQLCLAGIFFAGAFENMKTMPGANMQLIFTFCFGVWGGVSNVLNGLGIPLDPLTCGWVYIIASGVLFMTLPSYIYMPWTVLLLETLAAVGVLLFGLGGIGVSPAALYLIANIMFGGLGLIGFYLMAVDYNNVVGGFHMTYGKPIFKRAVVANS